MSPKSQHANSPSLFQTTSSTHSMTEGRFSGEVITDIPLSSCSSSLKSPPKHSCLAMSSQRRWPDLLKAFECSDGFISFFKCSKILMQPYEILNRKPCGQVRKQPTSFDMVPYSSCRDNWLRSKKLRQCLFVCLFATAGISIAPLTFTHFLLDHAGWTLKSFPSLAVICQVTRVR